MKYVTEEIHTCIRAMYISSAVYMILALYLNQVVPQEYGVPSHPLFFMEGIIRYINPKWHKDIFYDDDKALKDFSDDDGELKDEDNDVRKERTAIHKISRDDYASYPLIVKNIRKVYPSAGGRAPKVANKSISMRVH